MATDGVNWKKLYDAYSANVTGFNCGELCAPGNNGIPVCCVNQDHQPVLFRDELKWLRTRTNLWHKRPATTRKLKKMDAEIENYICYADCKGIAHCERRNRSLTCRFFPFEPYFDEKGQFKGLTWMYRAEDSCPLIGKPKKQINSRYIAQSINVWKKIFLAYPGEVECYIEESKKLRKWFGAIKRKIVIFADYA